MIKQDLFNGVGLIFGLPNGTLGISVEIYNLNGPCDKPCTGVYCPIASDTISHFLKFDATLLIGFHSSLNKLLKDCSNKDNLINKIKKKERWFIITLTKEQESLVYTLYKWFKNPYKPYISYTGAAGTGKTTVIKEFLDVMGLKPEEYMCAAYVGKAVQVLQRHGLPASTIHSLIYDMIEIPKIDAEGNIELTSTGRPKTELLIRLKPSLPSNIKLLIIDEATMVNDVISHDILSFNIPVIFLGDSNQLPPVFGQSSIMNSPDFRLTHIMRQAEESPIVRISQNILNNIPLKYGNYGTSKVIDRLKLSDDILKHDMIITTKNKMRDGINDFIRNDVFHIDSPLPVYGEKIICRRNNWKRNVGDIYLTNGLVGFVTDIHREKCTKNHLMLDFRPEFMDDKFLNIKVDSKYIQLPHNERKDYGRSSAEIFEYGYSITTHMSQGSEYNNVLFMYSGFGDHEFRKKLMYTGVTRAVDQITIVI